MEEHMMPNPAVAGILNKHFIEARHHTDHSVNGTKQHNIDFQIQMQGDPSLPFYMLINPKTDEVYGRFAGLALTTKSFVDFLNEGVDKSGLKRVASAD